MKKNQHKMIAFILIFSMFFVLTFSFFYIVSHENHICNENHCEVCTQIHYLESALKQLASGIIMALSIFASVFFLKLCIIKKISMFNPKTLISIKVRMNN